MTHGARLHKAVTTCGRMRHSAGMHALLLLAQMALAQPSDMPTLNPGLSKDEVDAALYSLGVQVGRSLDPFTLSPEEFAKVVQGMRDQQAGTVKLSADNGSTRIRDLEVARRSKHLDGQKAKGRAYVASLDLEKEHGTALPSGTVYLPVSEGIGPSPTAVDTVKVHYRGRLLDGREFDSSYRRGEPAEFELSKVVPCWTEGLQKMKAGGRAKLVCPSSTAYGDRGQGTIPPGATLLFDVELLDVVRRGSTTIK
jgi:FKBP-type peptidyl-prolyl cis-trans isomerase FkpA